jgi:hypothetical protein
VTSLSLYQQLAASISQRIISNSVLHNKKQIHIKQTRKVARRDDKSATGDKHQEVFPVSEGGNHQEKTWILQFIKKYCASSSLQFTTCHLSH